MLCGGGAGVRGITKTNKRAMKPTGIAECDRCGGKMQRPAFFLLSRVGTGMVKEKCCEMCPGRTLSRQSWGVADSRDSGFSGLGGGAERTPECD